MATLLDLAHDMEELAVVVKLRAVELTKYVSLAILNYLVRETPADTSKAISNWQVSIAGTSYGMEEIAAYFPGVRGSTRAASARAAVEQAILNLKGAQPNRAIAIINATDYIRRLNEGWSAQHPGGFVEASILVGKQAAREYNFMQRVKRGRPKAGELSG